MWRDLEGVPNKATSEHGLDLACTVSSEYQMNHQDSEMHRALPLDSLPQRLEYPLHSLGHQVFLESPATPSCGNDP